MSGWAIQKFSIQSGYTVVSKISSFQQNIMRHENKQESVTHTQKKITTGNRNCL